MAFKIAISDSYCTWEFPLPISESNSIAEVVETLYRAYNLEIKGSIEELGELIKGIGSRNKVQTNKDNKIKKFTVDEIYKALLPYGLVCDKKTLKTTLKQARAKEKPVDSMLNCKVGDKVKIIACTTGHNFAIGEIVTITNVMKFYKGIVNYSAENKNGAWWLINSTEIEKYNE